MSNMAKNCSSREWNNIPGLNHLLFVSWLPHLSGTLYPISSLIYEATTLAGRQIKVVRIQFTFLSGGIHSFCHRQPKILIRFF